MNITSFGRKSFEVDDWGDTQYEIAPEIIKNEENFRISALRKFASTSIPEPLNFELIKQRSYEVVFQGFEENPQSIFIFDYNGFRFVGKKYKSDLYLLPESPGIFCSNIQAPMIIGLLEREQVTQDGVLLFINPITPAEKLYVFNILLAHREIDIYYPYTQLLTKEKLEMASPKEGWKYSPDRAEALGGGESDLRDYTLNFLKSFQNLEEKKIFDPACSTGEFLATIKKNFPKVITIGQDLSASMVEEAKTKIDEAYVGNSIDSPVPNDSVDFIFFRFLNGEVVTTEQAYNLLTSIIRKSKKGGYIIIFGQTPVLVSRPFMEKLGLTFIQATGVTNNKKSVFQYYILQKNNTIKDIGYRDLINNKFLLG